MNRKLWLICLSLGILVFAMAFAACGDDDDATPTPTASPDPAQIAEVEDTFTKMLETDPAASAEVDFFLEHITAEAVKYFGYATAEECRAAAQDCVGDPTAVTGMSETTISGDSASSTASSDDGNIRGAFVRDGDVWKLDGYAFTAEIPSGVTTVSVSTVDYGFDWDKASIGDGNVAFTMKNDGTEAHEIAIVSVEDDFDVQALIDATVAGEVSQEDLPPGVTGFLGFGIATPGQTTAAVLEEPLPAGKYAFMCFLPDAAGTPHIVHGMYSEFSVE